MPSLHRFGMFVVVGLVTTTLVPAQDTDPYAKQIAKASDAGVKAIARFQVPAGLKVALFAAEPLLANPVAFCFDEKGRAYVAETFRLHHGVTDNRSHKWTDDDLAARNVADRIALYKKHLGKKYTDYAGHHDRVRMLEDTDGDGVADKATVFADGFNQVEDGLGSGVLAHRGKVWFTCIPHLWLLQDTKGIGKADVKKSLHQGYGVHVSFIGHDTHGLRMGPDGKLYFSIGDRGLHVETAGRVISAPDTGAVLRCYPDGSELEIVHLGLRNPQELAFDDFGNLFTGDNNADGGDQARWVQIVEGGDSGWRIGYQYLPGLGPWNREKMWHPAHDTQPAYIVPPLINLASGPSGLCYHPGVSLLPDKYREHFFLCDFRGGPGGSAVHAFAVQPKGASFEVVDRTKIISSVLATDCDFGPDGGLYVSDWVDGWAQPERGRIYKVFDPAKLNDVKVREVKTLLGEGMAKRSADELARLLEHADQRVRQEAQFTLAERGDVGTLTKAARDGKQLARLHAIWGLGQIGRVKAETYTPVLAHATDADAEVRAQALKALGAGKVAAAHAAIRTGLKATEPRVRYFSAIAAGQIGRPDLMPAVLELLRTNKDADPYLRHAGVMGLAGIADRDALKHAANDISPAVRRAVLLAMRRLHAPEIAMFLHDSDPAVLAEAARAIYDEPIVAALPELAGLAPKAGNLSKSLPAAFAEPLLFRIVAAHRRLGQKDNAAALAKLAGDHQLPENIRLEALKVLGQWEKPSGRDPLVGLWRPLPERSGADVAAALTVALPELMTGTDKVRAEGARLAGKHGIKDVGPLLRDLVRDNQRPAAVRVEALKALASLKDTEFNTLAEQALAGDEPRLRHQARSLLLTKANVAEAVGQLADVLDKGATIEKQGAFALLADLKTPAADAVLANWLDRLNQNKAATEVQLDVLEAARRRGTPELKAKLAAYDAAVPKNDRVLDYRAALAGGDADNGRAIFFNKTELSCVRCHKVQGVGGDVGPDLTGISKRFPRPYLLEALVEPDRQIAKGFDSVVLSLANGQIKSGILKNEDAKEVRLMTAEGQLIMVPKADIDERTRGKSAMPDDLIQKMTRPELRDLVEFLAGL